MICKQEPNVHRNCRNKYLILDYQAYIQNKGLFLNNSFVLLPTKIHFIQEPYIFFYVNRQSYYVLKKHELFCLWQRETILQYLRNKNSFKQAIQIGISKIHPKDFVV